ncbi:zinc finger protein 714-like [Biomphalaria glabrata]|uniref:Zinc finger protein 714-like n=1 Tax=Biomphalaria glabrata TaxID=6526 RepID=A0A9W2ZXU7_BIOGL|nr:zinc finger protein 714-like [Biomphalaria glabrata]XP_055879793.1 zinc finger protein 714-like [Biomphalaria glabrata]XP_055879794.1 zinc finger protein 714-like [Biomphalaria glabrata]XP_055879795.1 zinc finger protein 714-like [Biomphalaria glabrata]
MDHSNPDLMRASVLGDNYSVLTALASLFAIQHQETEKNEASFNAPFLVLTNVPGKDSLLANVILGTQHSKNGLAKGVNSESKEALVPSLEQVHAIATANLIASTQLDIAKQLAEENAHAEPKTCKSIDKKFNKSTRRERQTTEKRTAKSIEDSLKSNKKGGNLASEPKSLVCSFEGCNRKFAWLNHLKYHELTHTNNRQFKCPDESCGKTFFTAQRLNVHLMTHTGIRPFRCEHQNCGKTFTTAGNLKNHQRIHSGEQPFVCDVQTCGKRFTELSSLKKHKITHSGGKPFECNVCGRKFTQSGSRRQHMLRHHLEDEIRNSFQQERKGDSAQKVKEKSDMVQERSVNTTEESNSLSSAEQVLVLNNTYDESGVFHHGLSDPVNVTKQSIRDTDSISLTHDLLTHDGLHDETLDVKTDDLVVMSDYSATDIVYTADILDHEEVTHANYVSSHVDYSEQINPRCYSSHEEIIHPSDYGGQAMSQAGNFPSHDHEITVTDYVTESCISNYEHKELGSAFIDDTRHGFIGAEEIAVCHYNHSPLSTDLAISEIVTTSDCAHGIDTRTDLGLCPNKSCLTLSGSLSNHSHCALEHRSSDMVRQHNHSSETLHHNSSKSDIHMDPMMECDEEPR